MITWKEYLIMQFLNTVTFLIIQEFFWLKMKGKFDALKGSNTLTAGKEHLRKVHEGLKEWQKRQREGILQAHKGEKSGKLF